MWTGPIGNLRNGYEFVKAMRMRRHLVLSGRTARHPFLEGLRYDREPLPATPSGWGDALRLTRDDVRGFATSYVACLVAAAAFIF